MTESELLKYRLTNHLLATSKGDNSESIVSWMGAIQAQDLGQAKYAVGCRIAGAKCSDVEKAIKERKIIRTWAMRGTLHLMAAADVHWLLPLVTPLLISRFHQQFQNVNLAGKDFDKIHNCILHLLAGGRQLTRKELFDGFAQHKIDTQGQRGSFILYKAGWLGIICHGQLKGKQDTYTLLDEWASKVNEKSKEEALAELAQRYFQSHGPATLKDFISWSGLSSTDGRAGFELIKATLTSIEVNKQLYWMVDQGSATSNFGNKSIFLPGFDEYVIGYKERAVVLDAENSKKVILRNGIFKPVILKDGKIVGTWTRVTLKNKVIVETDLFDGSTVSEKDLIDEIEKYKLFMDVYTQGL